MALAESEPVPIRMSLCGPFDRITHNPEVMAGKACIRGMRVTAGMIVRSIKAGMSAERVLELFPYLEPEDIKQSLHYAEWIEREHRSLRRPA